MRREDKNQCSVLSEQDELDSRWERDYSAETAGKFGRVREGNRKPWTLKKTRGTSHWLEAKS
jgi:hypothetical protein